MKQGDRGSEVVLIQIILNVFGFYHGKLDGQFGPIMDQAVREFQSTYNLTIDGVLGAKSMQKIQEILKSSNNKLKDDDFTKAALELGVDTATIKAVQEVETSGKGGFSSTGLPRILFEGHIFWNQLQKMGFNPNTYYKDYSNVLYPKWDKKKYKGGDKEYTRLMQAMEINLVAALSSASYGMFQIMGFNYKSCDEPNLESFLHNMFESEGAQLLIFIKFIKKNPSMHKALLKKDWATFARLYNGAGYKENKYDSKLASAYKKYSK